MLGSSDLGSVQRRCLSSVLHRTPAVLLTETMVDDGKLRKDSSGAFDSVEQSWSRVVQGFPHGASWTSYHISKEIEQLQGFFTRVLELPHSELEEACRQ